MNQSRLIIEELLEFIGEAISAKLVARFANKELGVQVGVFRIDNGYSVVLRDTDSDELVGTTIFGDDVFGSSAKAKAIKRAKELVK